MNTPCGEAQGNARNINGRDNIAAYGTTKDRHDMATNGNPPYERKAMLG